MQNYLGRKSVNTEQEWRDTVKNIRSIVSFPEVKKAEEIAINKIQQYVLRYGSDNLAYGWSGGKDSIVLSEICMKAGINKGVFGTCDLEYPEFLRWATEHMPKGVEPVSCGKDMKWLERNQDMIFPDNNALKGRWYTITHRIAQKKYYDSKKLSGIILGRRRADGNFSKNGESSDKDNRMWLSPIYDWPHEYIFAYIDYYALEIPPIYKWKDGYSQGTHLWPMRSSFGVNGKISRFDVWREVYEIDSEVVVSASKVIPEAEKFLSEVM